MGDFQDLSIENTFFSNAKEWTVLGTGKYQQHMSDTNHSIQFPVAEFFIQKGGLEFQTKNFKPSGEIQIHSFRHFTMGAFAADKDNRFLSSRDNLPFSIDDQDQIQEPANEISKTILRNLPFARRGFIFKSQELQMYFNRQRWYIPDPNYKAQLGQLTKKEQSWLINIKN